MSVYKSINAVQAELCKVGIAKDSRNTQGSGYNFRGIDAVYNVLSGIMAKHGLCIIPRMIARNCQERESKSGNALFYVTVEAEFDLICADDGSKHTARTFGEAMDSGDKATNKAMSAAYKYMAFQTFAIPTEGDNDADAQTHEVKRRLVHKPTDGPVDVAHETMAAIAASAKAAAAMFKEGMKDAAFDKVAEFLNGSEEELALSKELAAHSTFRAYLKFRKESARKSTQQPEEVF